MLKLTRSNLGERRSLIVRSAKQFIVVLKKKNLNFFNVIFTNIVNTNGSWIADRNTEFDKQTCKNLLIIQSMIKYEYAISIHLL